MNRREQRARRFLVSRLVVLVIVLLLGQAQSSTHRLVHPLSASSCELCVLAHQPLATAPAPLPVPLTASEIRERQPGPFRSEPFEAIAASAERAPPAASA